LLEKHIGSPGKREQHLRVSRLLVRRAENDVGVDEQL
jgi:hypothetical protein